MFDVTNNEPAHRYELRVDGEIAIAAYRQEDDAVVFTHTEVPQPLEGKGIGSRLIAAALEDVRRQGLKILPQCEFVAAYIERHPDTRDLVAA